MTVLYIKTNISFLSSQFENICVRELNNQIVINCDHQVGHVLQKYTDFIEEDQPLLLCEENYKKGNYQQAPCERIVAQGAVRFLGKWPSHLFAAFLAGCFFVTLILIFILITIIFSSPAAQHRCRKARSVEIEESHNVYFVKHENRTWSRKELCYIETAARKHPELHIYMINLESGNYPYNESQVSKRGIEKQEFDSFTSFMNLPEQGQNSKITRNLKPEMIIRKKIVYHNFNVRNIDVSSERFFGGSMLSNIYKKLSSEMMEMAAKIYLLWNYTGVALNPVMYNSLNDLEQYFCDKTKDHDFTIELKGELQASGIPCHAFAGFLMQEIIKNRLSDQQHGLKQALNDFCPRIQQCSGVRILKVKSNYLSGGLSCPTVYPDGFITDYEDVFRRTEDLTTH